MASAVQQQHEVGWRQQQQDLMEIAAPAAGAVAGRISAFEHAAVYSRTMTRRNEAARRVATTRMAIMESRPASKEPVVRRSQPMR